MSKQSELDRLWRLICQANRELEKTAKDDKGKPSQHYLNLKRDMEKLKEEYEAVKGGGSYNPLSLDQGEAISRNTFVDKMLGRKGGDSHASVEKGK